MLEIAEEDCIRNDRIYKIMSQKRNENRLTVGISFSLVLFHSCPKG